MRRRGRSSPRALSSQSLVALPGAEPSVMDLPSISRVTKLPLEQLKELAKSTPIFAPGVEPLFATGAVTETWAAGEPFAPRLADSPAAARRHLRPPRPDRSRTEGAPFGPTRSRERVAAEAADHA